MMKMERIAAVAVAAILACGAEGAAQTTYVGASLFGDVVRTSHAETPVGFDVGGGGEAIGVALRAGTPLGAAWGVEVE